MVRNIITYKTWTVHKLSSTMTTLQQDFIIFNIFHSEDQGSAFHLHM